MRRASPRSPTSASRVRPRLWALAVAVVLLSVVANLPALGYGFVYDDVPQILENPNIQSSSFQPGFFTGHLWKHRYPNWRGNYYRPLFLVWMQANYLLFGAKAVAWHAEGILIHALTTLLVLLLARRLLEDDILATVAAAIFAVLPVHAEVVAWISGADESIACLLLLAALLCWMQAREIVTHKALWSVLALVAFAAAVLFKENAAVLPAIVIAYEAILGSGWRAGLRRSLPFWGVLALYLCLRMLALGAISDPGAARSLLHVIWTVPAVVAFYVFRLLWPFGMSILYDLSFVPSPAYKEFLVVTVMVVAMTGIAVIVGQTWRRLGFLFVCMALLISPFIVGLRVFRDFELVHDRYLYMPSVIFAILVAMGLGAIARRAGRRSLAVAVAAVLALFAYANVIALRPWHDTETLFQTATVRAPRNPWARSSLADELIRHRQPEAALPLYEQAVSLYPQSTVLLEALAADHLLLGHNPEAERWLLKAQQEYPPGSRPNGLLHYLLGMTRNRMGKYTEAEQSLRTAIAIHPDYSQYHLELALALKGQGRLEEAREALKAELAITPASEAAKQLLNEIGG